MMVQSFYLQGAMASIVQLYHHSFGMVVDQKIADVGQLLEQIGFIYDDYLRQMEHIDAENVDVYALLDIHGQFLNKIQEYNKKSFLLVEEFDAQKRLNQFYDDRDALFLSLSKNIWDDEKEENRRAHKNEATFTKIIKSFKQLRFKIQMRLAKKNAPVSIKKRIPLRYYLVNELYLNVFPDIWLLYKQIILIEIEWLIYFKQSFSQLNNNIGLNQNFDLQACKLIIKEVVDKCSEAKLDVQRFKAEKSNTIAKICALTIKSIEDEYHKLGTYEGRHLKYMRWFTDRNLKKRSTLQKRQLLAWEISLFGISEDWCFDGDLYHIINKTLAACRSKSITVSTDSIGKVSEQLQEVKEKVHSIYHFTGSQLQTQSKNKNFLLHQSQQVSDILSMQKHYLSKVNHTQRLLYVLSEIQQLVISEVDRTKDKRMIFSGEKEWDQMQLSHLTDVYLRELIQFEILPSFSTQMDAFKQIILLKIASYENEILNLIHISAYNFETVSSLLENPEKGRGGEDVASLLKDGETKVLNKLDEIIKQLASLKEMVEEELLQVVGFFGEALSELTENEKVGELNVRLLKAKAIRKTTHFKDLIVGKFQQLSVTGLAKWSVLISKGFKITKQLTKIYSQEEVQAQINNEISVFLSEIANSTEKLPFLYQRLFKLDPIDGGYLYFKRSAEIGDFEYVYLNWLKGRFATLAITAEKGAGITSVLNFVLKGRDIPATIINFQDFNKIYRQDEFIFTLSEILDLTPLNEVDLFIEELNSKKGIIVLEGLQFAYLKKVDGFETLKLLFEIMSKTNKSIFWVCTCTIHAWNYLNKAISIEEYFGHVITLGDFSNDDMVDIVKKRHQVSGYDLVFLKSKADVQNKKMSKLSTSEVQLALEKQYFDVLNSLAKGNLSVALIFWLRSIKRIEKTPCLLAL
ncbi:hypothetical protein [Saccharicrinis fermentans]|nr:hypothetical protein [Saccharicrinis fermentans]